VGANPRFLLVALALAHPCRGHLLNFRKYRQRQRRRKMHTYFPMVVNNNPLFTVIQLRAFPIIP